MKISGTVHSKHIDHIRLITDEKSQEVDVFYTEIWKVAVNELLERQKVVFSVKIQSVDYYGLKLGKFWLSNVIVPAPPPRPDKRKKAYVGDLNKNDFGEYPE